MQYYQYQYVSVTILFILAVAGWIKDKYFAKKKPPSSFFSIIIILLIMAFIFQICLISLDAKNNKYEKDSGELIFKLKDKINNPIFSIGGARFVKKSDDFKLFNISGDDLDVKIEKSYAFWNFFPKSQYRLNLILRNEKNEVLVKIEDNIWKVNPILIYDKNFTKNVFEVIDKEGNVILRVRMLDNALDFSGKFYNDKGEGIAFVESLDLKAEGAIIEMKRNGEKLESKIKPIFKYPSSEYPGIFEESKKE